MRERRGRPARTSGVAEGVAAAVRRRQREREPRVVLYDRSGTARVVAPAASGYDELLETGGRMVDLVGTPPERRSSSPG